jgi:CheY-like chemotaxis protein
MMTAQTPFTVLVVDDEALVRMMVVEALEDAGYRVLEAGDSQEALEMLREHGDRVQVLMTDVHMPGEKNGIALVQEVEREYPNIRSIVVSGKALRDEVPSATIFVPKPYCYKVIVEAVSQICLSTSPLT